LNPTGPPIGGGPRRYMALYKADYICTMERTNLKWNKTRESPPSIALRK
jgi:hypothetical protein